jgi:hypothetical protein
VNGRTPAAAAEPDRPPRWETSPCGCPTVPIADIRGMIDRREIVNSGSLVDLLYVLMDEAIR